MYICKHIYIYIHILNIFEYIYTIFIYIYANLPRNGIVRLSDPGGVDSQGH